jgi:hypothetical protein
VWLLAFPDELGKALCPLEVSVSNKPLTSGQVYPPQAGQDAAEQMARAFHEYQEIQFGPVHDRYLNVFRERLQNALRSDESPLLVAKIEAGLFGDHIKKLKSKMFDETVQAMAHWFDIAAKVGARPEIEALLKNSIEQFCEAVASDALKIAESYATLLKDAEAAWRHKKCGRANKQEPNPAG